MRLKQEPKFFLPFFMSFLLCLTDLGHVLINSRQAVFSQQKAFLKNNCGSASLVSLSTIYALNDPIRDLVDTLDRFLPRQRRSLLFDVKLQARALSLQIQGQCRETLHCLN